MAGVAVAVAGALAARIVAPPNLCRIMSPMPAQIAKVVSEPASGDRQGTHFDRVGVTARQALTQLPKSDSTAAPAATPPTSPARAASPGQSATWTTALLRLLWKLVLSHRC